MTVSSLSAPPVRTGLQLTVLDCKKNKSTKATIITNDNKVKTNADFVKRAVIVLRIDEPSVPLESRKLLRNALREFVFDLS